MNNELCLKDTFNGLHYTDIMGWGQGELVGPHLGQGIARGWECWPWQAEGYSSGVEMRIYSISPPKTVCAWWRAESFGRWLCLSEQRKNNPQSYGVSTVPKGWMAVSMTRTAQSGILGDLPDVISLTSHGGSALWTWFPMPYHFWDQYWKKWRKTRTYGALLKWGLH
jgi:hypothetical protein